MIFLLYLKEILLMYYRSDKIKDRVNEASDYFLQRNKSEGSSGNY